MNFTAGKTLSIFAAVLSLTMVGASAFLASNDTAFAWSCEWIKATPAEITAGESTNLSWSFGREELGVYVTIDQLPGEEFSGTKGSVMVSPTETTTYTATARRPDTHKTYSCKTTVTVVVPVHPPVCVLHVTPDTVEEGGAATLSWTAENGTWFEIDNGIGEVDFTGEIEVSPLATTVYTGTVMNDHGDTTYCDATLTVTKKPDPKPEAPVCTLTASPNRISEGATSTLSWTTDHAVSFEIDNSIGAVATGSDARVVAPAATTTYTGTATNSEGKTVTCEASVEVVPVTEEPPLSCSMSVSASVVSSGSSVVVSWTSENATDASINNGIGAVDPISSSTVTVTGDTTYTGTFTRDDETVTCSASVRISTGGGGGGGGPCINCGDDDDDDDDTDTNGGGGGPLRDEDPEPEVTEPTIVLSRTASAPGFVSLAQVPYTGFEAGPMLTMFFWLTVLGISAALVYGAQVLHPLARLRAAIVMPTYAHDESSTYKTAPSDALETGTYRTSVANPAVAPVSHVATAAYGSSSDTEQLIEECAHEAGILLSPEAARALETEIDRSESDPKNYLTKMFDEAQNKFSREDGWILLSKDRVTQLITSAGTSKKEAPAAEKEEGQSIDTLLGNIRPDTYRINRKNGDTQVSATAAVSTPTHTQPSRSAVPTKAPAANGSDVVAFLHSLVNGDQQSTYRTLRRAGSEGASAETFITDVVRALDEVYKHRIEGGHTPDRALVDLVAVWDNAKIEEIIGLLVESVDYSYSSPRIGTKVALAKVFDYLARN